MELLKIILQSSVITAVVGLLTNELIKKIKQYSKAKKEEYNRESILALCDVVRSMKRLETAGSIERVLLIEVSNGGDRLMPGSIAYANAIDIVLDDQHEDEEAKLLKRYTNVRLDPDYLNMCVEAEQKGVYKFITSNESPCLLKDFYINEGIKYSEIFHIYTDVRKRCRFIMSISTHKEVRFESDGGLRAFINTEVMQIRTAFKKYRE